jgi:IS5 family transposase
LALVTLLQFHEGLSDRGAAEAVRARIDWKYLLGLDLEDPGFDHSVLCEFRGRLLAGEATGRLLQRVLDAARDDGLLRGRGRQRTDSTHVLAAVRDLNRVELLAETLRASLNILALLPRREHEALAAARARDKSKKGKHLYAQRQGVEGTISQAVRAFGLRQARYRGLAKTGLQHLATAAALNLDRLAAWLAERPLAPTRVSRFAALFA